MSQKGVKTSKAAAGPTLPAIVQGLLACSPQAVNLEALQAMVGDARLTTQAEVARVFDMSVNTVKQSWSSGGMPGYRGNYPVAEILAWLIERNRSNASGEPLDPMEARLREIELRVAELTLSRKEREDRIAQGTLVDPRELISSLHQTISIARESLLRVGDDIEPMLPVHCAVEIKRHIYNAIHRRLTALGEECDRTAGVEPTERKDNDTIEHDLPGRCPSGASGNAREVA